MSRELALKAINVFEDEIVKMLGDMEKTIGREAAEYIVKRLELALEFSYIHVEESEEFGEHGKWDGQEELFTPWETNSAKRDS